MRRLNRVAGAVGILPTAPKITRKEIREYRSEQRRLEFVEVRKRGGGYKERARRRRQMGQKH